jgi:hypothetical protein
MTSLRSWRKVIAPRTTKAVCSVPDHAVMNWLTVKPFLVVCQAVIGTVWGRNTTAAWNAMIANLILPCDGTAWAKTIVCKT